MIKKYSENELIELSLSATKRYIALGVKEEKINSISINPSTTLFSYSKQTIVGENSRAIDCPPSDLIGVTFDVYKDTIPVDEINSSAGIIISVGRDTDFNFCFVPIKIENIVGAIKKVSINNLITIKCTTSENVHFGDYCSLNFKDKQYYFKISSIKTYKRMLKVKLTEDGRKNLSKVKDLNPRELLYLNLILIVDEGLKKKIREEACYC